MSNPQIEDGYTRIANELLDAIVAYSFTKRQYKLVFHIIRKTYGFGKKVDDMTVTQVSNHIGLDRSAASKALDELVTLNVVIKTNGRYGYLLGINKNYQEWGVCQNITPVTKRHGNRDKTSRIGVIKHHTQKITSKDNSKTVCAFDDFYAAYPKKKSRQAAQKAWKRINPDSDLLSQIMGSLEIQKRSPNWNKDNGQFIPYPASWLNGHQWEDEADQPVTRRLVL